MKAFYLLLSIIIVFLFACEKTPETIKNDVFITVTSADSILFNYRSDKINKTAYFSTSVNDEPDSFRLVVSGISDFKVQIFENSVKTIDTTCNYFYLKKIY